MSCGAADVPLCTEKIRYVFPRSSKVVVVLASLLFELAPCRAVGPQNEPLPSPAQKKLVPEAIDDVTPFAMEPETKPIGSITTDIRPPSGNLPDNVAARRFAADEKVSSHQPPRFSETVYFWQASNLAHKPLRFEQAYVERYGYNYGILQPIVSGAEFAVDVAASPVKCLVVPSHKCIYTLGTARPGTYGTNCPRKW